MQRGYTIHPREYSLEINWDKLEPGIRAFISATINKDSLTAIIIEAHAFQEAS